MRTRPLLIALLAAGFSHPLSAAAQCGSCETFKGHDKDHNPICEKDPNCKPPEATASDANGSDEPFDPTNKAWATKKRIDNAQKAPADTTQVSQEAVNAHAAGLTQGLTHSAGSHGDATPGVGGRASALVGTSLSGGGAPGDKPEGDPVKLDALLARMNRDAAAFAKERPDLAQFVQSAARRVGERIDDDPSAVFSQKELDAFITMMRIQADKADRFRELRERRPPPSPEERRAIRQQLEQEAEAKMNAAGVPHGNLMHAIHEEARTAWQEQWRGRQDPDPDAGRPSRTHIDGMLQRNPGSPGNWSLSAADKLANNDRAGGLAALDRSISLGGTAEAFGMRSAIRSESGDFDGAYLDARKALELNPGDKNLMFLVKNAEGRVSPALIASAAAGGSGSAGGAGAGAGAGGSGGGSYENRGAAGFAAGGFDTGRPREVPGMTSPAVLSSNQKLDEARRALAMGDLQAALSLAQRALDLNPANSAAHNLMSFVYSRLRDYPRAIASASAGLALEPRSAALLNNKAYAQNHAKRYREGLETSTHAIEADARNAYSYANRAYAYGGLGDRQSMLADIGQAAALDPSFKGAAAEASELQLPSNADILFMFPGENPAAAAPAAPARSKSFGVVVGAGILGGLLLALGLLSTVLAPLKDSVVSAFTKATRRGPSVHALEEEATPAAAPAPEASGVIRGQYEIVRQIGAGGMGMVYEGTDRSLGRRVAIKKMRDELRINPRERERFVIEAKTVASLRHPNIVDIYAIAEEGDDVYLVFEFIDGKTIHDLVQSQGRLNRSDAVRVTAAMGEALTYAHAHGVIHRDMKPSNVMLTSDGRIKVMDFGIARMAKDALTRYSMTNTVVGTPPYMAPEQEQGVVRKESDVYSLAICSYEMLTGKLPFIGVAAGMLMNKINMSYVPPSRAIAGLPESIDEVFLKAFQADPDQRYRTPKEFSDALESAFGGVHGKV